MSSPNKVSSTKASTTNTTKNITNSTFSFNTNTNKNVTKLLILRNSVTKQEHTTYNKQWKCKMCGFIFNKFPDNKYCKICKCS